MQPFDDWAALHGHRLGLQPVRSRESLRDRDASSSRALYCLVSYLERHWHWLISRRR